MPNENIEDIEQRLEQRRQDTAATINALEQKLSPGQLLDQVMGSVKSNGGDLGRNLGDLIKQNPLGLALVGAGIAMMATNRPQYQTSEFDSYDENEEFDAWRDSQEGGAYQRLHEAERSSIRSVDESDDAYNARLYRSRAGAVEIDPEHDDNDAEAERSFREKVDAKVNAIKARAYEKREEIKANAGRRQTQLNEKYQGMKASAQEFGDNARNRARSAQNQAQDMFHQNPLGAGLLALAAGALAGGAMPPAITPDSKYGGDAARKLQDKAREAKSKAEAQADAKAKELAEKAQAKVDQA